MNNILSDFVGYEYTRWKIDKNDFEELEKYGEVNLYSKGGYYITLEYQKAGVI